MSEKPFNEPRIALNRIYTRTGDGGETSLVGGQKVSKDDLRIECYGTVDELNAFVGMALQTTSELVGGAAALKPLGESLLRVQHELFNLGSVLATLPRDLHPRQPRITETEIALLEREIDLMNAPLMPLRSFVLPGGTRLNVELHACRTICRRAERLAVHLSHQAEVDPLVIQYLNRLNDAFFVWSRWANLQLGVQETLWEPNHSARGANQ
jgi:cob(I)alamin adenosyltransferase